ncbi:hypothetical protein SDC9_72775 [bioreactor metagenome]|uniref:Uncharacterized protein n=1 Tax=bioreactor metagenome TaxID=1076179 RepID=A0A644YJH4_9ZZZZ
MLFGNERGVLERPVDIQTFVFIRAEIVERAELPAFRAADGGNALADCANVFHGIRCARYDRGTNPKAAVAFCPERRNAEVAQNHRVAASRPAFVIRIVHDFKVVEQNVRIRQRAFELLGKEHAAGIDRGLYALRLEQLEQFHRAFLQQGFAAGKGNAAVAAEIRPVLDELAAEFGGFRVLTLALQRERWTGGKAGVAACAEAAVDLDAALRLAQRAVGADIQAGSAADAARGEPVHLKLLLNALRVMAPGAGQRTAFEKDGRAQSRAVLAGHTLYVEIPNQCHAQYRL